MYVAPDELQQLLAEGAIAYTGSKDGQVIAFALIVPEKAMESILVDCDPEFKAVINGCYCYSIAVHPDHQGNGYGQQMVQQVAEMARQKGFTSLSAHVRTSNNWNERRAATLLPQERRTVNDFWPTDGDVEFQRVVL